MDFYFDFGKFSSKKRRGKEKEKRGIFPVFLKLNLLDISLEIFEENRMRRNFNDPRENIP